MGNTDAGAELDGIARARGIAALFAIFVVAVALLASEHTDELAAGIRSAQLTAARARAYCAQSSLELQEQVLQARLEAKGDLAVALDHVAQLDGELGDARLLAALGYAPQGRARRVSVRVSCDGSIYLPGSKGEAAWRALRATGLCDSATPVPEPEPSPNPIFQ